MKIVFFDNPEFAAKSLEYLNSFNDINIELVVTNPDKKMGRGLVKKKSPVKKKSLDLSLKIFECNDLKDDILYHNLKKINADLFIVIAYKFIPKSIYQLAKNGAINLHASLLPKYRGASPIQYALLNGEDKTGLTTFFLNDKIDRGKIISQLETPIDDLMTFDDLYNKLSFLSKDILKDTIIKIKSGLSYPEIVNNDNNQYLAPKITKNDYKINWEDTALNIHNKIRAFSYKGAYALYKNKRIKFFDTYYSSKVISDNNGFFILGDSNNLLIATKTGHLIVNYVQIEGSNKISANDFMNSNPNVQKFE